MPATSQQQQKLFGLALAVKRGEVSPSEVSDEVRDIVDRMSEKDIEDFAGTSHKGLPHKVEAKLRETLRELMREMAIQEAELPKAAIPANIKTKLVQAIDKIKDTNLNYNQKLQVIGKIVDSLGIDKKELAKMSSKLKTTLESLNEADPCWKGYQQIGMKKKNGKEVPNCVPESVNEAAANPATKKFLKGMQSIKVNTLGGYMPGVRNVYWDKKNKKFWFVDFEGDHAEILNIYTLKQLDAHIKKSNITLESVNEGKKRFNTQYNVGKAKYVVNYHDGKKTHKDGSDFFDIQIFKNQKDFDKFQKALLQKGFVEESVNEAGVSKLYSTFLDVEKKLKELEATQKEMAKKYFDEKDAKKKADLLDKLKKGTKVLQATRKNLSDIEAKYVMGLDKDAELQGESVKESHDCGCGCGGVTEGGCGGSKVNEALKADPRKVYGGTGAKEGMVLVKQAGFIKILELSKKNPSNVFVVSDDNYTNFGPFYVKNGKVAKYTVANPNYDLEKNKVRSVKVPNDVILKFKVVE